MKYARYIYEEQTGYTVVEEDELLDLDGTILE